MTTNRAGCREIIEDGRNGFLVKQQDADDLTAKVEKFIALPYAERKAMGDAAREKVEREFDRNIVVQAYLKEIKSIWVSITDYNILWCIAAQEIRKNLLENLWGNRFLGKALRFLNRFSQISNRRL